MDSPSVSASSSDITVGSGSNPNWEKVPLSTSPSHADGGWRERPVRVVVVEDNLADAYLIREAIQLAGIAPGIDVARDGESAIRLLEEAAVQRRTPDVVILDLNLPKKRGAEVLRHMRAIPNCDGVVVVAASSTDSETERNEVLKLGAKAFFRKPSEFDAFLRLGTLVKQLLEQSGRRLQ